MNISSTQELGFTNRQFQHNVEARKVESRELIVGAVNVPQLLSTRSAQLTTDVTNSQAPSGAVINWETLISLSSPFVTVLPSSTLDLDLTVSWLHSGVGGVNVATAFRFVVDSVGISGSATSNALTSRLSTIPLSRRVPITAGSHTIAVEWAWFGPATQTVSVSALSLVDLAHATIRVQELRS